MAKLGILSRAACIALVCAACGASAGDDNTGGAAQQPPTATMMPPAGATAGTGEMAAPSDNAAAGAAAPSDPGGSSNGTAGSGAGAGDGSEDGDDGTMSGGAGGGATGPMPMTIPSARGMCDIDSGFPGDEACLAPPDPDKGFQIHIGPSDYTDAAQIDVFKMEPGEESSQCYMKKLPLDHDAYYLVYELSGRPGTHHIINTLRNDDVAEGFGSCVTFAPGDSSNAGSIGGASKPHMPPMPIAPENEHLGIPLTAHMQAQHDMHYFNLTNETILREFWMNVYYVPEDQVQERPNRIAGLGGFSWTFSPIQPGTHQDYTYECPIESAGRIIQLLGHTHAHGIRETAWIVRASDPTNPLKVFEQYDYLEPQIFMYDSLAQNPEFSDSAPGAYSGILEVAAGDTLRWQCEINNDSETPLRYTNAVQTGEMCNIWGMTVGPLISCFLD